LATWKADIFIRLIRFARRNTSVQAAADRNYRLSVADVRRFEAQHGEISQGTIVLLRTGWSEYWPDANGYLGDDKPGDASNLEFPGFGAEAVRLLAEDRRVAVLGVDSASIDYGPRLVRLFLRCR